MNHLKREKQQRAIAALVEGSSIRSVERMTGIHRDTIMRLMVRTGTACQKLMSATMTNLSSKLVQVDECWTFVGKKRGQMKPLDNPAEVGDFWIWVALDADTKLVPVHRVGKRSAKDANHFIKDLASRITSRIQISSDGLGAYVSAIEAGFGGEVDYGQTIKDFRMESFQPGRYGPPKVTSAIKRRIVGNPDFKKINTSYVEKQNHTLRSHVRRMTRLTNGFSKKAANLTAAVALHYAYYNYVKIHQTLKCTPAMAAKVTSTLWSLGDLIEEARAFG